ncbi:MAG: hypothetical protein AB7E81_20505 [Hyphomicrobiaceae bacterium]
MTVVKCLAAPRQAEDAHARHPFGRACFFLIATALGIVSVSLAGYVGAARGVDLPSKAAWGVTGGALALGLLLAPPEGARLARQRRYGSALAAILLAVVCAAFVISGSLGNASSGRVASAKAEQSTTEKLTRAKAAYDNAVAEIATLGDVRLPGELEADIAPLTARIGDNDCAVWVSRRAVRAACADRAPLLAELARARRKATLEKTMSDARLALDSPVDQRPANEDAKTVARFLSAIGVRIEPDRMSDILIIVAVLSLEAGGALSLSLAQSIDQTPATREPTPSHPPSRRRFAPRAKEENEQPVEQTLSAGDIASNVVRLPVRSQARSSARAKLAKATTAILMHAEKGTLSRTQRLMAKQIGVSTGTISMALMDLERTGRVTIETGAHGTAVVINRHLTTA